MKKLLSGYCWFYLLIFFISSNIYSQQLPITVYSSQQGAPVLGATSVFQDKHGWIWFTNGHDVVKYNGFSFKSYPPGYGTKVEFADAVLEVNDEIWILSTPYPLKVVGDSLMPLTALDRSIQLLGNTFHHNENYFLFRDGLGKLSNGKIESIIRDSSISINSETSLIPFNDSVFLSYEFQRAFLIFEPLTHSFSRIPLPVIDIKKDSKGNIYLLIKGKGLFLLSGLVKQGNTWSISKELFFPLTKISLQVRNFVIDQHDNFWIPDLFKRLIKISPSKSMSTYTEANGLPSLWFGQLFVDRENNLWIICNSTICKIREDRWQRYTKSDGLSMNYIFFIIPGMNNKLYIEAQNGLNVFSNGKFHQVLSGKKPLLCTYLIDRGSTLYYIRDSSLYTIHIDTSDFHVGAEKKIGDVKGSVVQILEDSHGTIFITTNRGLFAWFRNKMILLIPGPKYFRRAFIDSRNQLWLGEFLGGLSRYRILYPEGQLKLQLIQYMDSSYNNVSLKAIRAITEDHSGNIIAGTRYDGVFYLKVDGDNITEITRFGRENGINNNSIWSLQVDSSDAIWVGNTLGLNKIKRENTRWVISNESRQRQIYSVVHIAYDRDRFLWLGSYPGVIRFKPSAALPSFPFMASITEKINEGKPAAGSGFSYRENNFSFSFSSNTYLDEKAVLYSYRLIKKGNEVWSPPADLHTVNYSSLLPGKYKFQVKALNLNGGWSENEDSYGFEIYPPFWQRTWFIVLMISIIAATLYALYKYRVSQILRLQAIRNSISRNLHDDIGASLSNINILNELATRNIGDASKARSYLGKASEDIQRISESLSDIVWNINPRYDQIGNLFIRMKRYAADMMDGKLIRNELIFPDEETNFSLPMDQRRDFYLIYKEAINNLVKYSGATEAKVDLSIEKNRIILLIEDNGVGFYTTEINSGNGLHNMKQRAEKWNAPLIISSEPGKGTRIVLEMKT
jgi:ligand-binding sensor domain-containing protein/two-component sensor histidine kinase